MTAIDYFNNIKVYQWFKRSLEVQIRIGVWLKYCRQLEYENIQLKEYIKTFNNNPKEIKH